MRVLAVALWLAAAPATGGRAASPKPKPESLGATTRSDEARTLRSAEAARVQEGHQGAEGRPAPFDPRWLEPYFTSGPVRAAVERFRLEDWAGAAAGLTGGIGKLPRGSTERLPALVLLAMARMNLNQWSEAGALFEELHGSYPLLAPYHAYHAARCRLRRGDTAGALAWVAKIPAGTVPEAEGALIKLDALAAEQRHADVEAEARAFLERFPAGPRRAEASFRRAEACEKLGRPVSEAAMIYRKIWAEAPTESWAARAEERLAALAAAAPPSSSPPEAQGGAPQQAGAAQTGAPTGEPERESWRAANAGAWMSRGLVFFERNQNVESEAAFAAALAAPELTPALTCQAAFHRAQSVFKQRQRPRAASLFGQAEAACRAAGERDLLVKALYQGARCQASGGDRVAAIERYGAIEREFPEHSYADDARLRAAELAAEDAAQDPKRDAAVRELLEAIPSRYPKGDQLGEALWRLAFRAIEKHDHVTAHRWLDENLARIPRESQWFAEGRALYWKGRLFDKDGRRRDASTFYTRTVREYPLSVYAFMALERLRRSAPAERAALVRELRAGTSTPAGGSLVAGPAGSSGAGVWRFPPRTIFGAPGFRRAVELARLGLGGEARRELGRLGIVTADSRDGARKSALPDAERGEVQWITAVLLDRGRVWSAAHAIPRYTLTGYKQAYPDAGRGGAEWRIAYPRAFPELVTRAVHENGLPAALVLAFMREESAFNPKIESFANALGLTQMLVTTAQRFSAAKVTRDTLLDPARNLELGAKFMAFLVDHFDGRFPLVIAGYNAGEGAVDRWLRDKSSLELDAFLESIPYEETRGYTKRVLASYFTYSWLYAPDAPVPALSFSLRPEPRRQLVGRPPTTRPLARRPQR